MTLDDLIEIYNEGTELLVHDAHYWDNPKPNKTDKRRAGIRAILLALRNEYTAKAEGCETVHTSMSRDEFNSIIILDALKDQKP